MSDPVFTKQQMEQIFRILHTGELFPTIYQNSGKYIETKNLPQTPQQQTIVTMTVLNACMDFLSKGGRDIAKERVTESQQLEAAVQVLEKYKDIISNNAAGRNCSRCLPAILEVIRQLSIDLIERNPPGLTDKTNSSFPYCLGRQFKARGLILPPAPIARNFYETLQEAIRRVAPECVPQADYEDSTIIHMMQCGGLSTC